MSYSKMTCPYCGVDVPNRVDMPTRTYVDRFTCSTCGETTLREELVKESRFSLLRGGGAPSTAPPTPPPVHVPIGRTARGAGNGATTDGSGLFQIAANITVGATGSTLVVMFARNENGGAVIGMTWAGIPMSEKAVATSSSFIVLSCFVLENATAGTDFLVVDDSLGAVTSYLYTATEVTAPAVASFDKKASATGTGTAPSSGNTPATTQAAELLVGGIWRSNATINGTLQGSFTQGQTTTRAAPGNSLEEVYRIVSATGTYAAAKTGSTSAVWAAVLATFKEN